MLQEESIWIRDQIPQLNAAGVKKLLNVGSSTLEFRNTIQPHMKENVFDQLEKAGIEVMHLDMKPDVGVDLVGDLTNHEFSACLRNMDFDAALINNVLVHVKGDVSAVCLALEEILPEGGMVLLTNPFHYPTTPDPYDNHIRQKPQELAAYFPRCSLINHKIIEVNDSLGRAMMRRKMWGLKIIARMFLPFYNYRSWEYLLGYLPGLFKPYAVSCAVLRKR